MAFNTGNALGSTDPRDFSDNAENFDNAVNNTASATWTDRFGNSRTSIAGQVGYIGTGTGGAIESYTSGLVLTTYSTIIFYSGEFYRPSSDATLPYTTTATTPDVDSNLVAVGDAVLRQDLANSAATFGSELVARSVLQKKSIAEVEALTGTVNNIVYLDSGGRSGHFYWDGSPLNTEVTADTQQGIYIAPSSDPTGSSGAWVRRYDGITVDGGVSAGWFGAVADGVTDDSIAIQAAIDYGVLGKRVGLPSGTILINSTILVDTSGLGNVALPRIHGAGMYDTVIDNQTGDAAFRMTSGTAAEFAYAYGLSDLSITSTGPSVGTIGVELNGCRFANLERLRIEGMDSHGIYGLSTIGDNTDTAQINIRQVQIENCGGYGIFPSAPSGAIQYNWNIDQCRIGLNSLGGILFESMVNAEITNTGIFYNQNFGFRNTSGGVQGKNIRIRNCEFDTNDGVQIDLIDGIGIFIEAPYLISNTGLSTSFSTGIVCQSGVTSVVIQSSTPRIAPSITGITVHQFDSGCSDVVVRDTIASGFSVSNGDLYVINEPSVAINDASQRVRYETGSYTAELKDSGGTKTSSTTVTAYYTRNGNLVTVGFRDLNNVDLTPFAAGDFLVVTLPFPCISGSTASFSGNCVITSDAGSGVPFPVVANGGQGALFARDGTDAFLTAGNLTDGVSDFARFTVSYLAADL